MDFASFGMTLLLVFGFGFVIFWHELGHFLAAKWAGVRVEQFAVGFGQAMISWRQGLGFRRGTSRLEYEGRLRDYLRANEPALASHPEYLKATSDSMRLEYASAALQLSETEYRLNWIPLGGYVKMLGQDDLDPNSQSDSPRAYNNKSIGKRMVIVSAGVIMNIILAIILFTILFRMGFDVPPAVVGSVAPGSPAQQAGVQVGDRITWLDGEYQHDFTKLQMNVALMEEGKPVPLVVEDPDHHERKLTITPRKAPGDASGFLRLGVEPSLQLRGPDPLKMPADWRQARDLLSADVFAVEPGDVITAINGEKVEDPRQFYKLDRALQASMGTPVTLELRNSKGQSRQVSVKPIFGSVSFTDAQQLNFLGLVPRASIVEIIEDSSARGKLLPGDVILSITLQPGNDPYYNPTPKLLRDRLQAASRSGGTVDIVVLRGGKELAFNGLVPQTRLEGGQKGLGIGPDYDVDHSLVGGVIKESPADRAQIPAESTIVSIDGQPISSWYDVHRVLKQIGQPQKIAVVARTKIDEKTYSVELTQGDLDQIGQLRYVAALNLQPYSDPRKTTNPLIAARWGIAETRGMIMQFYLTIRRMAIDHSVSASNMMGPLGMFHQGSKIAQRGMDWLIWFLAMISANLAVVNFLPIPIVDGGLFVFLILEKIMGKPLSPRAQGIAQIVGLALIVSVFLFVTYHDIARMIF